MPTTVPAPRSRERTDQLPMTKGVLDAIIAASRQGYFVLDVQFVGAEGWFRVFYDAMRPDPQTCTYTADGVPVST